MDDLHLPKLHQANVFDGAKQFPGASYGNMVDNLPGNLGRCIKKLATA